MNGSMDLSISPLFEAIQPKTDDQRKFLVLLGYIRATTDQTVTFYPDLDLRTYLEIPRGEIVWAEKAVPGQQASATKLVINANAQVRRVTTTARQVEVGFLSGMISSSCLPTSAAGLSLKVTLDEAFNTGSQCNHRSSVAISKGTGGSTNLWQTSVCIDDGPIIF